MRKKIFILCSVLFLSLGLFSQTNLVPNPGFENFITGDTFCNAGYINDTPPWINPTGASPNCFKSCCWNQGWAIPQNAFGFQYPFNGIGYAGFGVYTLSTILPNGREYIQVKLLDSLKENIKYLVKFYVCLADSEKYATDDIGLYFSDTAIYKDVFDHSPFSSFIPQIENTQGNIITDKENWTLISGIYIAQGGEQYITIGNFYDDANTDTLFVGGGNIYNESYYYIDDVSVTLIEDSVPSENTLIIPNAFTPNSDGYNDYFKIKGQNIKELHGIIFNRWGQQLYEWSNINEGWNGRYNNTYVSGGAYFYIITATYNDGTMEEKKGAVMVVR